MFSSLRRTLVGAQPSEEDLLRRAMGQLYSNAAARERISQRLRGYDIENMNENDIYNVIRDVLYQMRLDTYPA
jgi:hypothetical protein